MTAYASQSDLELRYPDELILLAADENDGSVDADRVAGALASASTEIRGILKARYGSNDLNNLDADSLELLKVYAIDIGLYRIALSFSRSNDQIKDRYEAAIKRLEAIASGKGGLSFEPSGSDGGSSNGSDALSSPNEVLIDAPERVFTRDRLRGF
ncbi:hypothetical protein FIV06_09035 [Labrenzia sp. THAF191b]|uniref:gp436 family protein n=1 Tax=unclassified Labrenzia TaxID=2648686 RepID=UPI001268EC34|nr:MULTISPECIES: DUF1320 domain-containing protein [unclassified Labrenzia]QFS97564.1 hypothetical protein FIV06_09035 [Labrenzia sp. THAF191b]QFT03879.1 hypothetical protein FIV05_09035 [Labrenzia sp. THAF191a]QFT15421.1 hypothetical protein FIV03_09040 [Labrenzia sp. THAF187b]QFT70694.1 hypothetical protein FIU93_28175 [Labrenzia sp. THAF35]